MNKVKFAVFTDLHYDHIPDGMERLKQFINRVKAKDVDFIIQLGDLCTPKDENKMVIQMLDELGLPHYHVLGNHDCEYMSKDHFLNFTKLTNTYYRFKCKNTKFIVLDTCFIKRDDRYHDYRKEHYDKTKDIYPIIPDGQLEWLKDELSGDSDYFVIFSHHSLENDFSNRGVSNRLAIRSLIDEVNKNQKKVILCVNGHDHADSICRLGKTHYFSLNSMSYVWVGPQYEHFSYSNDLHQEYPSLKDITMYKEGFYAIITISKDGKLKIEGMEGQFQAKSPQDLGIKHWNGRTITPKVSSFQEK